MRKIVMWAAGAAVVAAGAGLFAESGVANAGTTPTIAKPAVVRQVASKVRFTDIKPADLSRTRAALAVAEKALRGKSTAGHPLLPDRAYSAVINGKRGNVFDITVMNTPTDIYQVAVVSGTALSVVKISR